MNGSSLAVVLLSVLAVNGGADENNTVDYVKDIKPILAARCYACHGAIQQKGGLRVDTAAFLKEGGNKGAALVPGEGAGSLLIHRLLGQNGKKRMPPESEGEPLKPAQITLIQKWIDEGAKAPKDEVAELDPKDHWAFKKPKRPALPTSVPKSWSKNPLDAFVAAAHAKHGLTAQPPVGKTLLLRRVYLDLTGLPPTEKQINAFLNDKSPAAYEKVVDRLLGSPQYGERWGRHWMDVWRYSDWWGLGAELRNSQKHMWHWRDWIVASLNKDKGYDRMLLEMLAADELYPTDWNALPGTGFLARHYFKFNRTTWLDETIEHTGKAFLGLTFNCAKCHDHKYDPISHKDYYSFRAIFEPYQVRLDQVPGQIDYEKDGLPRVFDCNLDAATFLHLRGNEQNPDKKTVIVPGLPAFLVPGGLEIKPIMLPPQAHNPGLRPFVLEDHLKLAENELAVAEEKLVQATAKAKPTLTAAQADAAKVAAEKMILAAKQHLATLTARAAADKSVAEGADPAATQMKTQQAALAEKQLAAAKAEVEVARAEEKVATGDKNGAAKVKQAQTALDAAKKALANPGTMYTPLAGALKTLESNLESDANRKKPFPKVSTGRRTALAKWIANKDNPLTARVAVNHIWTRHFGQPLVASVFDFGRKGAAPTHPELLDWLAVEFMDNGWSMKHLHRLIVTSNTYRLCASKAGAPSLNEKNDPDNKYLWRMNSQRMESQVVRDSLLYLAGELDLTLAGPSVEMGQQKASKRRSLYFFHSAINRNTFLTTFDEADALDCYRRRESIVPQQALALSNSALALNMANKIALGLEKQLGKTSDEKFVRAAFTLVLCFEPNEKELSACTKALASWRTIYAKQADAEQQAHSLLVLALLNHNDFVTVR